MFIHSWIVWPSYEITLFSNTWLCLIFLTGVWPSYEITLFSNNSAALYNLMYSLTILWNYTVLKPVCCLEIVDISLTILWNYTVLKHNFQLIQSTIVFDHPMKLHCSQTEEVVAKRWLEFDHPMKLHCSQTIQTLRCWCQKFDHPMKLHCSQTV